MNKGFIHIYTGDGKGKTTAALGLTFRSAGRKRKTLFVQFLKGIETGELFIMMENPYIEHLNVAETTRFFNTLPENEQSEMRNRARREWADLIVKIEDGNYDVIVLDEIMAALHHELIEENAVIELLKSKQEKTEMILTGRNASSVLIGMADLVTEMKKVKHYYDTGVLSRKGIEY